MGLLVLLALLTAGRDIIFDIPVNQLNYRIEETQGYQRIFLKGGDGLEGGVGGPELPVYTFTYLIPTGVEVNSVSVLKQEWKLLPGEFKIYPKQPDLPLDQPGNFVEPDSTIYNSSDPIPASPYITYSTGNLRGYELFQVMIAPFKYIPCYKHIYQLQKLKILVRTKTSSLQKVAPLRQTYRTEKMMVNFLSKLVINRDAINNPGFRPRHYLEDNPTDLAPTDLPSLLGPPVDLVIITDDEQKSSYKKLARLKKLYGFNSVVKTMAWVREHYTGIDDAEQVRNFIRDAMQQWGTYFVVLGGDVPNVPTRYVWMDRSLFFAGLWLPVATDLYFACLDGNWNFDSDNKFGEVEDSVDLYPDVFVGRISTKSADESFGYFNKLCAYLFPENYEYQTKALFYSSNLDYNQPGLYWAYQLAEHLPTYFTKSYLDETLGNFTPETLLDSLRVGFSIVAGIGHGDVNKMCYRFLSPRDFFTNYFFDTLDNNPLYSGLLFVVTCYTNPYQSDCLGEHWLLNPSGGGLAYIGPTSTSQGGFHKQIMEDFLDTLFTEERVTLSEALELAKVTYIPNAQYDGWHRLYQYALMLLGDPAFVLWKNRPLGSLVVTTEPETLRVGVDTVKMYLDPSAVNHFDVQFYKENETFIMASGDQGFLACPVKTKSEGFLKYLVNSSGYIPCIDSIYVAPAQPFLAYEGYRVFDTLQNSNGIVNPGEDIFLGVSLRNNGTGNATAITAKIVCLDSTLTMINDTSSFPDIPSDSTGENITPYYFRISNMMGDGHSFNFELQINYSGGVIIDSFQIVGSAPVLYHYCQNFYDNGDTVVILPWLENLGSARADSVYARISSDSVTVLDSMVVFPKINSNTYISSAPDSFKVYLSQTGTGLHYNYRVYCQGVKVIDRDLKRGAILQLDSLISVGRQDRLLLKWPRVTGAVGYRIYRATDYGGPYIKVSEVLDSVAYYEDFEVEPGVDYFYYVIPFDSSMNQGICQDTILARINPSYVPGWPTDVYDYVFSSPNFGDIDPYYPGLEIVVGAFDGWIYAWHCDGTPVVADDGRLFYSGSNPIWSSPALGDVNGDGLIDIVFGVLRSTDNLYVITYNPISKGVIVLPGWPQSLDGSCLSSPVLADIDNNGKLEIFSVSFSPAGLYAFRFDGSGLYTPSGLLKQLYGGVRGTLAIGDINQDGDLEILCGGGSETDSFFVWDKDGQYLQPFPVVISLNLENGVVIGDVLGDGNLEICTYSGNPSYSLNLIDCNGNLVWSYQVITDYHEVCPLFADFDNDGKAEVIFGYNDGLDAGLVVLDSLGNELPGFPRRGFDAYQPIVVDADGDGEPDILSGSTEWNLNGTNTNGTGIVGFPIKLGSRINASPFACDINNDGRLELGVACFDMHFHLFQLESDSAQWPKFHYDPYNSGCFKSGYYELMERNDRIPSGGLGLQIYPNPFTQSVKIILNSQNADGFINKVISVHIYDVTGRLVRSLSQPYPKKNGDIHFIWEGDDNLGRRVPSGVYFIRLEFDTHSKTYKVVKIK